MRHACISLTMAAVLVITSVGTARAGEREGAGSRAQFAITPAMARALSHPVSPSDLKPIHPETLEQPSSTAHPGRPPASKLAGGLAFGFIGMMLGAGIGAAATRHNGGDSAMVGGFYGSIIGGAAGAGFGVWLAGR